MQEDQYRSHGVWQLLSQARQHLEDFPTDQQRTSNYSEAKEKVEYLLWILDQSDPALITAQELDNVQNPLQQAVNHIAQSSGRAQRLSQLDQWFAPFVAKFPYPRVRKIFRSERTEILNDFERDILDMRAQLHEFRRSTDEAHDNIKSQTEILANAVEETKAVVADVEARVRVEFDKWEAQSAQEISERLSQLNKEFSADQAARSADHQTRLDEISEKLREIEASREAAARKLDNAIGGMTKNAQSKLGEFETKGSELLGKIREIYEISGQTALAGDFENAAKSESFRSGVFAVLATVFFAVTPIFFVYQWSDLNVNGFDPLELLLKLSAGLAFLIPAAYFGNSSRRHHRVATALRSLGIKVATFDAYLANFPDSERNRIKEQMAELFFTAQISPDQLRQSSPKEVERALGLADTALAQAQATLRSMGGGAQG